MIEIQYTGDNLGGTHVFYIISLDNFIGIRTHYVSHKKYLEIKNREKVIALRDFFDSFGVSEERTSTEQGIIYNVECRGRIPRTEYNEHICDMLLHQFWYLLAVDATGNARFFGESPCFLHYKDTSDTGTISGDTSQIEFSFSGSMLSKGIPIAPFAGSFF